MDLLQSIEVFLDCADTKSFTKAAARRNISIPNLSKGIQKLEAHLGIPLFLRSTRKIAITEAGILYLEKARKIVDLMREGAHLHEEVETEPHGLIRIAAAPLLVKMFLMPKLSAFQQKYPKVRFEILNHFWHGMLQEGKSDLVLTGAKIREPGWMGLHLGDLTRTLLASPSLIKRVGMPTSVSDFEHLPCLVNRIAYPDGIWHFGHEKVRVNAVLSADDFYPLIEATMAGMGIMNAILNQAVLSEYLETGALQVIHLGESSRKPHSIYVYHLKLPKHHSVKAFVDFLST